MTVVFGCRECGKAVELDPGDAGPCPRCGASNTLATHEGERLEGCLACGCSELYRHRDFNQKLGLVLLALGVIAWWLLKSFWPMVAAAGVDLSLFLLLPDVAICYRCKAHHRGLPGIRELPPFDLERHEHYRFTRAREEGKLP